MPPVFSLLPGRILSASTAGAHEMLVVVGVGEQRGANMHILSRISRHAWNRLALAEAMPVYAQIRDVALIADS